MGAPKIHPEPDHEPIGFSDEVFPLSRHWLALAMLIALVAAAGVIVALRP